MLEIVQLIVLWRAMGSLRRTKRRPALGFQILAVAAWLGGEFIVGSSESSGSGSAAGKRAAIKKTRPTPPAAPRMANR